MKRKIPEALLNQEIRRRSNKLNNALMKKFPFFNRKNRNESTTCQRTLDRKLFNIKNYLKLINNTIIANNIKHKFKLRISKIELEIDTEVENEIEVKISTNKEIQGIEKNIEMYIVKERALISEKQRALFKDHMPSRKFVDTCNEILEETFEILNNDYGSYCNIEQKIRYYFTIFKDEIKTHENNINLRFTGDGYSNDASHSYFSFNFGFLDTINDKTNPNCVTGNFAIGVFKIDKENIEILRKCLKEIVEQMRQLKEIIIDNNVYNIVSYLGGDLKFIAAVLGVGPATSSYPCPLCFASKNDFYICDILLNKNRVYGNQGSQPGQLYDPIIDFIPADRVVYDLLHMYMRITDKKQDLLIEDLHTMDAKADFKENNQMKFVDYLQSIKINNKLKNIDPKSKKIEIKSLNGVQKRILMRNINLIEIIPSLRFVSEKNHLWKFFDLLFSYFKDPNVDPVFIKEETYKYLNMFSSVYYRGAITPYIHLLTHANVIIMNLKQKNLSMNSFSMQGSEKLNHFLRNYYRDCTNKKDNPPLQVLKKRNRLEIIFHKERNLKNELLDNLNSKEIVWRKFVS